MNILKMIGMVGMLMAGLATTASAGKVKLAGDFDNTAGTNIRTYQISCSKSGKVCATIKDGGFHFNNILGARVKCTEPIGHVDDDIAKKPGGQAKACAECTSGAAAISLFCATNSEFCNDGFIASVTCKGEAEFEEVR